MYVCSSSVCNCGNFPVVVHDRSRMQFWVSNHAHWEILTKTCFNLDEINQNTKVNKYKVDKYSCFCTALSSQLIPLLPLQLWVSNHAHWEILTKTCFNLSEMNRCTKVDKYTRVVQIYSCPLKLTNWWQAQNFLII